MRILTADEKQKFPASGTCADEPEPIKTWTRPVVSRDVDLDQVRETLHDAYFSVGQPRTPMEVKTASTETREPPKFEGDVHVHRYKKVADRVRPIPTSMPEDIKVKRSLPADPLENLPRLPTHPPDFTPTQRMSCERMDKLGIDNNPGLTEEEKLLLKYVLVLNERSIAFEENERGTFRQDYFTDYQIPVTSHVPWADKNIPLPPGQREEIIRLLKEKMEAGVYEKNPVLIPIPVVLCTEEKW